MKAGKMFLRSQIDARGTDADGNPIVFELKTRATAPLRYDIINYIDFLDYNIVKFKGQHSSFEREYYDLIRGGFLKYIM
jgi:Mitochondrial protein Pet127